jgi:hypothetical protein
MANPLDKFIKSTIGNDIRIPSFPNIVDFVQTHGMMAGLGKHAEAVGEWRTQLEQTINERLAAQQTTGNTLTAAVATNTTSTPVASVPSSSGSDTVQSELDAHISATKAHGTAGNVVGTSDKQDLDNKDIGKATPGFGRFTALICSTDVPVGRTVTILANESMVLGGTLTVSGTMNITGTLTIL